MTMNQKRLRLLCVAGSIATVSLLCTSCGGGREAEAMTEAKLSIPTVAVAIAGREDLAQTLTLTAEFKSFQEIDVMAKVAGYVKHIYVDVGDRVRQGQLLALLEVPEMTDDLTRARAAIERSRAEVERARSELTRAQSARDIAHLSYTRLAAVMKSRPGLVAQQEVDDAHSRDLVAEAQVSAAKSALVVSQEQVHVSQADEGKLLTLFNYTKVAAPFAGVVTNRLADTGSMIQAGTASESQARPLVTLSENSLLRLILPVPESAVPSIHLGTQVDVYVPSLNRSFPGCVARFAGRIDFSTRTMETEVDVPNASLVVVPGMFAQANITLSNHAGALTIPLNAIADLERHPWVMLVNPSERIEHRAVTLGIESGDRAEVLSGLKQGDRVVIGNRSQLSLGQIVTPKTVEIAAIGGKR